MWKIVWLAAAGAAGTLARYGLQGFVQRLTDQQFPWGTFAVNAAGCLAAGLFWAFAADRAHISSDIRTIVMVGFMGGFTTFSAYMAETGNLFRDAEWFAACGNIVLQNGIGLVAFLGGLALGRLI